MGKGSRAADAGIAVRRWRPADKAAIWRLIDMVWAEFGSAPPASAESDLADIAAAFSDRFWVATAGDTTVVTIALKPIGDGSWTLKRLYVLPAWRGGEAARRLLGAAIDAARRDGGGAVWLGTAEEAVASHRFHEKHGFERVGAEALPAGFFRSPEDSRFYRLAT